ncbi:hypothetical protein GUJ93_ZPchr1149g16406 [Zizania palustris]|uniref:Uncharacterized protein n=1 Tax=Zizania palustris TaxID=103762 RepID=A0A8J5R100_ZIZPA|nr:hypothetical protein GUJ93_ZPchr1149g16406 [Zizania palustris]
MPRWSRRLKRKPRSQRVSRKLKQQSPEPQCLWGQRQSQWRRWGLKWIICHLEPRRIPARTSSGCSNSPDQSPISGGKVIPVEGPSMVSSLAMKGVEPKRKTPTVVFVVLAHSTSSSYGHECSRLEGEVATLWDRLADVEEKASTLEDTLREEQQKNAAFEDEVEN